MNEYIDREALRQAVLESQHNNPHPRGMAHIIHDCEHAHFVAMIARSPAADVAPVVRCKGCKHLVAVNVNGKGIPTCRVSGMEVAPDEFCSRGEAWNRRADNG